MSNKDLKIINLKLFMLSFHMLGKLKLIHITVFQLEI